MLPNDDGSAGHRLGQMVGDWWERHILMPFLDDIAERLDLFSDARFKQGRTCRADKVIWNDLDNNEVDYDFVLELGGTNEAKGTPVAFLECFWRRGARHSKDKARDDTNKLLPMRETYPTARLLAIAACGEFTEPAKTYVKSRDVQLFFVPKLHVVGAFRSSGIEIDYPDKLAEVQKARIADRVFEQMQVPGAAAAVAANLRQITGAPAFDSFAHSVISALSARPQEIRIVEEHHSEPVCFDNVEDASLFIENPEFSHLGERGTASYVYEISYSDGTEFSRELPAIADLRELHNNLLQLVHHMEEISGRLSIAT